MVYFNSLSTKMLHKSSLGLTANLVCLFVCYRLQPLEDRELDYRFLPVRPISKMCVLHGRTTMGLSRSDGAKTPLA